LVLLLIYAAERALVRFAFLVSPSAMYRWWSSARRRSRRDCVGHVDRPSC